MSQTGLCLGMSPQVGNALLPLNATPIQPPCFADSVPLQDKRLPLTCRLRQPAPCLFAFSTESFLLCPLPSSLAFSPPTSPTPPYFGSGHADPSIRQPPDRELTWTLDTVPARLTRLFAQSRVDNSSSTITSARADHVWNREDFNAVTTDVEESKQGAATLSRYIPQSH